MDNSISLAERTLLTPSGLDLSAVDEVLSRLASHGGVDAADLYFQYNRYESWSLEDGIVKSGSYGIDQGVGVRVVSGEKQALAYSDDITLAALHQASRNVSAIARSGQTGRLGTRRAIQGHALYPGTDPLPSLPEVDKIQLLERLDAEARAYDPRIKQVMINLACVFDVILVAATDGTLAADARPLVRLSVSVVAEQGGRREQGGSGGGGRSDYHIFMTDARASNYAREAARQAIVNLEAIDAPAGAMTVVLGPGWPGVLLHEAIGHGLEGDFNRKGSSAFAGRLGQRVATPLCTVVDNGTLAGRRGSLSIDDEGTPT
ncbi:MAG: metallopeptidase TldD-related protein, partial [Pseudomonadota bacterium]